MQEPAVSMPKLRSLEKLLWCLVYRYEESNSAAAAAAYTDPIESIFTYTVAAVSRKKHVFSVRSTAHPHRLVCHCPAL